MDMYDFSGFIEEFNTLPPVHEIARAQVLMPGDEGYKKVDERTRNKAMKTIMRTGANAPDWFKRGFEKLKAMTEHKG